MKRILPLGLKGERKERRKVKAYYAFTYVTNTPYTESDALLKEATQQKKMIPQLEPSPSIQEGC